MKHKKELEQIGCRVFTEGGTGLLVSSKGSEITLLHITHTGMAVGTAGLNVRNARRLVEELERAIRKTEEKKG